jgi:hypothetical protein
MNNLNHSFSVKYASIYGLECAIILAILKNQESISLNEMEKKFSYWTDYQLQLTLQRMIDLKLIKFDDKSNSYSLTDEEI